MGSNWLSMAWLGRSVTGLGWGRFAAAQAPAAMLALLVGGAAMLAAEAARAARLGNLPILIIAGLAAAVAALGASRLRPRLFLGEHGAWAYRQGEELLRRRTGRGARPQIVDPESLASAGEGRAK
jgi:hypothetical protein